MANQLDTVVVSEPETCRAAARWLGQLRNGVHDVGSGLHKARSTSESCWEGSAGEAFRQLMSDNAADADEVAEYLERTRIALDTFADEISTVTARIQQACEIAVQAGLHVDATAIYHPVKPPVELESSAPGARLTEPDRSPKEQAMLDEYSRKMDAFLEAGAIVRDARGKENSAHDDLVSALKMNQGLVEYLVPQGWAWAPVATGAYSGPYMTAKMLGKAASTSQANANGALAVLVDPELTQTDRQKILGNQIAWGAQVKRSEKAAATMKKLDAKIPGGPKIKGVLGWAKRGVGGVGALITAFSTYDSIQKGVPADKAITKAAAQTGTVAAVATAGGAVATYVGGTVATGGALLIGTALAAGVGYAVDHYYHDWTN